MRGRRTIDYSNNDGVAVIGSGEALFETKWTRGGGASIYAYSDPRSIDAIALAVGASEFTDVRDAGRFDYSSRVRSPQEGQILLVRNIHGKYAAVKILDVKAIGYDGEKVDELTFEFLILEDGSSDFLGAPDMQVVDSSFSRRVLLIGAGFSRNWGGLLVNDVTGRIMAHPAVMARPTLRPLLLAEPSFEDALEKARTGLFTAADAAALETAINAAFASMDEAYRNPEPPVLNATVNDFIGRFCPGPVGIGTGYVFSLNQDLLLERIYGTIVTRQSLVVPGATWQSAPHPSPMGAWPIPLASPIDPAVTEPQLLRSFNFIKLHGSINWRATDGSSAIVMGRRKPLTIAKSPLIEWYHRVFERVLATDNVRLMVIGYGWGDEHINAPIANAIRNHNLQIYSWDRVHPRDLLNGKHRGDEILRGVMGFSLRPMTEVMPPTPTNPGSADYDAIVRDFF